MSLHLIHTHIYSFDCPLRDQNLIKNKATVELMQRRWFMSKKIMMLGAVLCASTVPAFGATQIDLSKQPIQFLRSMTGMTPKAAVGTSNNLQETSRSTDFNQTTNVGLQQTYAGFPVWGGDIAVHIPHAAKNARLAAALATPTSTMNGTFYQDLAKDLKDTPAQVFTPAQAEKAMTQVIKLYEKQIGRKIDAQHQKNRLLVYVDENNKAHWGFNLSFYVPSDRSRPAMPSFLIDAINFDVYQQWDNIQTLSDVKGGGFGGNEKTSSSKMVYDGMQGAGHLSSLNMQRNDANETCYLQNAEVQVADFRISESEPVTFKCSKQDVQHNNLYWDGQLDAINGAYSPNNDALYFGQIINGFYKSWYGFKGVLIKDDKPMVLSMVTHSPNYGDPDNAFWDPQKEKMFFGDGKNLFYPLTSLGVTAHEISHGFTSQHSDLKYFGESGGMNEAFSDMAAQAAEFYAAGKNSWQIGPEIVKVGDFALRYLNDPMQDCHNPVFGEGEPGKSCSLDNAVAYSQYLQKHRNDYGMDQKGKWYDNRVPNVHLSSGIYNKAFYLLATSQGWNVRKAFDVMVQAQTSKYWTSTSSFKQGACGVMQAARDYKYDTAAVAKAFNGVGIDMTSC